MSKKTTLLRSVLTLAFLMFLSMLSFAQKKIVTGTISDEKGNRLSGATIQEKGTSNSTISKTDGSFQITTTTAKPIFQLSFVGYESREVALGSNTTMDLKIISTQKDLDDVVVIGYGTRKRSEVNGAVSSLKNSNIQERAITRVDQALVGQLAGVTVKQTSGAPGKAFSIQVRGTGSISGGNEPLYVIDGFPLTPNSSNTGNGNFSTGNPLDNINPNDIESVEVLKDAAAAAIYGSRGSNGVVLITTKRGTVGKPKLSFNAYSGYNQASKQLKMLNDVQWINRATEIINATYIAAAGAYGANANDDNATRRTKLGLAGIILTPTQISTAYMPDPRWAIPGHPGLTYHDWQNEIEQKGQMQNYEVSASGGNEFVKYFFSGNYANQEGFIRYTGYRQYSARANVEITASKRLKFGLNLAPSYSVTRDPGVDGKDNIFHQALSFSPLQEDSVGKYPNIGKNAQYTWSNSSNGSLGKLENVVGLTKRYRTLGTVYGELQIIKGLTFRTSLNLDNTDNVGNGYTPYIVTGTAASRTFTGSNNILAAVSGSYSSYRRQTFVNENTLNYSKSFPKYHSTLNVLAGHAYNLDRLDRSSLSSSGGYTNAVIQTLNAAAGVTGNTTATRSVLISYFGRVQYGYKEKYFVTGSLRTDGSSRFGINKQQGTFPSASVGWRVTKEKFMENIRALSDFKLRFSYGVNGNNNIGDYGSIPTLGSYAYVTGATPVSTIGQAPNVLANTDLQWERSETYDFGFDFGLLKNRISGSFDYYNKKSTKLLLNVQVPEVTGFSSSLTNIGAVRNIGQELQITSRNLVGKVQWNTSVNLSHNTNKILALAPGQTQIIIPNSFTVSDQILRVGSPLNSIYVLKTIGFITAADIAAGVPRYGNEQPGDLKFEDLNHDGIITEADKQILGHPNPDYTYGITNTVRFLGFDLSVLVQGQWGGSIYSQLGRAISRPGQGFTDNTPASFDNRWRSESNTGDGRFGKAYSTYNSPITAADDWLYSSDYIRVRNITIGYDINRLIKKKFAQSARVYMTMENFFGHDKYTNGLNPEAQNTGISSNGNYPEAGDYGGLPLAKSLIFGVNFTF